MSGEPAYSPFDRTTFNAIALNALGRASEIECFPAYALSHSTGNSGWSVGAVQWDFGQPGRGGKVADLLAGYQTWAPTEQRFTAAELASLSTRLQTRGQVGNALTTSEQTHLGEYLRSEPGRAFVDGLGTAQLDRKWERVGQPLSEIPWLSEKARTDPAAATEVVALAAKLFNQNENKGAQLIRHLQAGERTPDEVATWIGTDGISGLKPVAQAAILSGRDKTRSGVSLFNALEASDGRLGEAWRAQIHTDGNTALARGFATDANVQLLDAMMRNPVAGERILAQVDGGARPTSLVINGVNDAARREMARVSVSKSGTLTVDSPGPDAWSMTPEGWARTADPLQTPAARPHQHTAPPTQPGGSAPGRSGRPVGHGRLPADAALGVPDHLQSLLEQSVRAVSELDRTAGRSPDEASHRLALSLAVLASESGLSRIDHVVLSNATARAPAGDTVFAVEGGLSDPTNRVAAIRTSVAVATPTEASLQRMSELAPPSERSVAPAVQRERQGHVLG